VLDQAPHERCRQMIRTMPIPRPFDLEMFRLGLGRQRGRALRFVAAPGVGARRDLLGVWLATDRADHIFYPQDATPLGQLRVLAREIGHMVLAHEGGPAATSEIARLLLPSFDPALVLSTLGRTRYCEADEEEAEIFAVLLLDHMEVEVAAPPQPAPPPARGGAPDACRVGGQGRD
jgi:hypothetical protein